MSDFLRRHSSPSKLPNQQPSARQQARLEKHKQRFRGFVGKMERGDVLLPVIRHPLYYSLWKQGFREYPEPTLESQVQDLRKQIGGLVGEPDSGYVPAETFKRDFMAVLQGFAVAHNHHDKNKLVHLSEDIGPALDYLQANHMLVRADLDAFFGIFGKIMDKALSDCKDEVKVEVRTGGWQDRLLAITLSYRNVGDGHWTGLAGEAGLKNISLLCNHHTQNGHLHVDILVPLAHPGQLPGEK